MTNPTTTAPHAQPEAVTPAEDTGAEPLPAPVWLRPVRGRHRRPRPRRVLFAVGGLALAAGALSLVRMASEAVTGGAGSAEAEPRTGVAADDAGNAVTAVEAVPSARPVAATATAVMGGVGATPTSGVSLVPTPPTLVAIPSAGVSAPASGALDTTGIPTAPATAPPPAAPTPAAPRPTPSATTRAPDPKPDAPDLCVPVVGICVNDQAEPLDPR